LNCCQKIEDSSTADKALAIRVLSPVITLLDQAIETEDSEQYIALISAAHQTATAMMGLLDR
jgi:hypothetical protein